MLTSLRWQFNHFISRLFFTTQTYEIHNAEVQKMFVFQKQNFEKNSTKPQDVLKGELFCIFNCFKIHTV